MTLKFYLPFRLLPQHWLSCAGRDSYTMQECREFHMSQEAFPAVCQLRCLFLWFAYTETLHGTLGFWDVNTVGMHFFILSFHFSQSKKIYILKRHKIRDLWIRAMHCGTYWSREKAPGAPGLWRGASYQSESWHATLLIVRERIEPRKQWEIFEIWLVLLMLSEPVLNVHTLL